MPGNCEPTRICGTQCGSRIEARAANPHEFPSRRTSRAVRSLPTSRTISFHPRRSSSRFACPRLSPSRALAAVDSPPPTPPSTERFARGPTARARRRRRDDDDDDDDDDGSRRSRRSSTRARMRRAMRANARPRGLRRCRRIETRARVGARRARAARAPSTRARSAYRSSWRPRGTGRTA